MFRRDCLAKERQRQTTGGGSKRGRRPITAEVVAGGLRSAQLSLVGLGSTRKLEPSRAEPDYLREPIRRAHQPSPRRRRIIRVATRHVSGTGPHDEEFGDGPHLIFFPQLLPSTYSYLYGRSADRIYTVPSARGAHNPPIHS